MKRKKEVRKSFRKKVLIAGVGFLFLVLLVASFFGKRGLLEIYQAQKNKQELLQKIDKLQKKKSQLKKDIKEIKENPEAVEKKARKKLWLVRPDEIVIVDEKK